MASARKPLPPLVVIDHPDQPISPRQRAAWWHVAAALQRLEQQKIAPECPTHHGQGTTLCAHETTSTEPLSSLPQRAE